MKQIVIKGNHLEKESHELLEYLYDKVLKSDRYWHFFWEGDVIFIRCSPSSVQTIINLLNRKKVKYQEPITYKENIPITKKYLKQFKNIFHEFSVLRMESKTSEFFNLLERITHCFINTNRRDELVIKLGENIEQNWTDLAFEPMILHLLGTERAMWLGKLTK